jgi:predicted nucleic acid-binding protein
LDCPTIYKPIGFKLNRRECIFIESNHAGLIHSVGDVLKRMRQNGYWIHNNIVDYALKIAHEI